MHDIVDLERRGIPGVFVASSEFVSAADAQSTSLGFPDVAHRLVDDLLRDGLIVRDGDELRLP